MSKRMIAIAAVVVVCLAAVFGMATCSARAPQDGVEEQGQEAVEAAGGESGSSGAAPGGGQAPAPAPSEGEGAAQGAAVEYSGIPAQVNEVLTSATFVNPSSGASLVFREDGTYGTGAKTSDAGADEFRILAVKGGVEDAGGCTCIVKLGEAYDVMTFMRNTQANAASFSSYPESPYKVYCDEFGEFYRDASQTVAVQEVAAGPAEVVENQKAIADAVSAYCLAELPTVTEAAWTGMSTSYWNDPEAPYAIATYRCNDSKETVLNVVVQIADGACFVAEDVSKYSDGSGGGKEGA